MAARTLTPSAPLIQGVASPDVTVDPEAFYAATRRMRFSMKQGTAISGLGSGDNVQLRQTGIISSLELRVYGSVTFGGTITGTTMSYNWPFGIAKLIKLSANGQSNLVSIRGLTMRALEFISNPRLQDNGLAVTFGAAAATQGSLKLASDDWGTSGVNVLNPGATVAAVGAYTVDLTYFVPVALDPITLIGSVYAQSAATNLSLDLDWETQSNLLTLGGAATFASALNWSVTGRAYSIPNVNGRYVVPDLSQFHQLSEIGQGGITQGMNEPVLPGTGAGRKLCRLAFNVYSGSTPTPLAMTAANFSTVGWAYGGNDQPEAYPNGTNLRAENIRLCGTDIGGLWGFGVWDFVNQFALRDIVDEAMTSDLRLQFNLVNSPTSGRVQFLQETLFAAPVGA